ncbi:hypothetical protein AMECASPLE_001589 [Ameca splendens]|uniref:Uncharacterized protein n=1 Tax=Ameca splendens TaxID=208324 RepID=A0ABV0XBB6_9TELE
MTSRVTETLLEYSVCQRHYQIAQACTQSLDWACVDDLEASEGTPVGHREGAQQGCLAVNLFLRRLYGRPGAMQHVWLPRTAAAFHSRSTCPLLLRCCGLQAFYRCRHTSKCTLPCDKLTLTHANSTQTHLFLHICSPTHTQKHTHTCMHQHTITQMDEGHTNTGYYNNKVACKINK